MRKAMPFWVVLALPVLADQADGIERTWDVGRLTIQLRAGKVGNLTWQLDTLAGATNTKPKDYEDLWQKNLSWSAADARQLEAWSKLRRQYRVAKALPSTGAEAAYPPNYARFYGESVSRDYQFRIAALEAASLDALAREYRRRCGTHCAGAMMRVLQHFWPRFSTWWESEGLPTARRMVPQMAKAMDDYDLGRLCEAIAGVTGTRVPARHAVGLDVVVHPKQYLTNFTATVMDNHVLTEVVEDPEVGGPRMPLLIHELTHHFYDYAARADHLQLIERFRARPEAHAMAAYSLLNEGLASAVQLLVDKRQRSPAEFAQFAAVDENIYFDPFIARTGRALLPVLEQWLAERRTIFDEAFVPAYLKVFAEAMGPLVTSPRLLLSSRALIHSRDGKPARDALHAAVRGMATMDSWKDLRSSPDLSGVVFLTRRDLGRFLNAGRRTVEAGALQAVRQAAHNHSSFIYAWPRSPKAFIYFLYGDSPAALGQLTRQFSESDRAPSGLDVPQ